MLQPIVGTDLAPSDQPSGGCYGVQVLVAGHQKHWRNEVAAQIRRAGFQATACDSALDALTVLVLGLPVDVLVADLSLEGTMGCSRLAVEARALRPGLPIVLASDRTEASADSTCDLAPDALLATRDLREGAVANTVREVLTKGWASDT